MASTSDNPDGILALDDDLKPARSKRARISHKDSSSNIPYATEELAQILADAVDNYGVGSYEDLMEPLLEEYLNAREAELGKGVRKDEEDIDVRPLTRSERDTLIIQGDGAEVSLGSAIILRKLKLEKQRRRENLLPNLVTRTSLASPLQPLETPSNPATPDPEILAALYSISSTPYEHSFLSRLHGATAARTTGLISVDWETRSPWMELMRDIRDHYVLAHPERDHPDEAEAAISYVSLQPCHLPQIHDLLTRTFWANIDVSDSLQYSPHQCTVVATYKSVVVGVAILTSPEQTYLTYLAVRAGWENCQIATTMLYHLITRNPHKDITLHVSVNSPAMLLYNRFGFKAEEFIAGFYESYLPPESRASKNAFRLRLRR